MLTRNQQGVFEGATEGFRCDGKGCKYNIPITALGKNRRITEGLKSFNKNIAANI